jgi:hypothetical protein
MKTRLLVLCALALSVSTASAETWINRIQTSAPQVGKTVAGLNNLGELVIEDTSPIEATNFPGVDPTGATDSRAGLQNAIDSSGSAWLDIGPGTYWIEDALTLPTGKHVYCAGRTVTVFLIKPSFNMSAAGAIKINGPEPGATIENCGITFVQPTASVGTFVGNISGTTLTVSSGTPPTIGDAIYAVGIPAGTTVVSGSSPTFTVDHTVTFPSGTITSLNRSALIHYPPAIYAVGTPRFTLNNVRVSNAWECLNATGNTGGSVINVECNAFSNVNGGFHIDGALDFISGDLYCTVFGLTSVDPNFWLRLDQNTKCLELGRADGISISLKTFTASVNITAANTGAEFLNLKLDGGGSRLSGALNSAAGIVQVNSGYAASGSFHRLPTFSFTGIGNVILNNFTMQNSSAVEMIHVGDAGSVGIFLTVNSSDIFRSGSFPNNCAVALGSGGVLTLTGNNFRHSSSDARTTGFVCQTAGTITATGNKFAQRGSGSGPIISVATDSAAHYIAGNNLNNWSVSLPLTSLGYYDIATPFTISAPSPAFETPDGDAWSVDNWSGAYWRRGDFVRARVRAQFDLTQGAAPSGAFLLSGMGLPAALAGGDSGCAWNDVSKVTHAGMFWPIVDGTALKLKGWTSGGAATALGPTAFPSANDYVVDATCDYRVR